MIRVAIDGTPLLGARTGIGEVVSGLATALGARTDLEVTAYALTWRGRHDLEGEVPPGVRAATSPIPARFVRAAWMHTDHPRIERWTGPLDVVHATNYVAPPTHGAAVVSVYDLTFVRFPELCTPDALQYPTLLRRALARGASVHTTSDFVAAEVAAEFSLAPDRIIRVYPGVPTTSGGDAARGRATAGFDRYVLSLGTIEPRKNLPGLVHAFDAVAGSDPDVGLVVAGAPGWGADQYAETVARARHGDRIRTLGYVPSAIRSDLLAGAAVLAYPSRYEGFGFPPLEAMAAGVPVVATRAGAIPEVVGDAALLVDVDDADELAGALLDVLSDDERRRTLVTLGHARVQDFSWSAAAAELAEFYERLA